MELRDPSTLEATRRTTSISLLTNSHPAARICNVYRYSNPSSNIISTQDQILFGNEKFPIQVSKAGLSWNERERLGSKEFSPTIPLDDSPLLLLLSLLLLFAVVVVDATRTRVVLFSIVGGGCVEDRTRPVPRFVLFVDNNDARNSVPGR